MPFAKYKNKTWKVYTKRIIGWLEGGGLIILENGLLVEKTDSERGKVQIIQRTKHGLGEFLCEAPPQRIMEAIRTIKSGITQESQLLSLQLRNALACMRTLDIIDDRRLLHEDLVNVIRELEEIRKVLDNIKGILNGS